MLCRAQKRLLLLDYDGTLVPQSVISSRPTEEALAVLRGLCADACNDVYIISGRRKTELAEWFAGVVRPHLSHCGLPSEVP
jgi:trehalose 6-phosphate synthase/phosphatase